MGMLPFRTESRSGKDRNRDRESPRGGSRCILAVRKDLNNFSFKLMPTKTWCH